MLLLLAPDAAAVFCRGSKSSRFSAAEEDEGESEDDEAHAEEEEAAEMMDGEGDGQTARGGSRASRTPDRGEVSTELDGTKQLKLIIRGGELSRLHALHNTGGSICKSSLSKGAFFSIAEENCSALNFSLCYTNCKQFFARIK